MDYETVKCMRHALVKVVSVLLIEEGIERAQSSTISTITELLQSLLRETGRSAQALCELAGRTRPTCIDVFQALSSMGIGLDGLQEHIYHSRRSVALVSLPWQRLARPRERDHLQVGPREKRPRHIPRYLPRFPDPHTYKRTECICMPTMMDSETVRRKKAEQRRCVERAMISLEVKAKPLHNLFSESSPNLFPLISCQPKFPVYRLALMPGNQDTSEISSSESHESEQEEIDNPYLKFAVDNYQGSAVHV